MSKADFISIHTPIKGVTNTGVPYVADKLNFNPHTHKGCDCIAKIICMPIWYFNPHTHKGCDHNIVVPAIDKTDFNPHTHKGCDNTPLFLVALDVISIHTPIKGVTRMMSEADWESEFQSTHP